MGHPDEHTLELFAVGSSRLGSREAEVRLHLAQCSDCRRIVEEKEAFYAGVGDVLENLSTGKEGSHQSLHGSPLPSVWTRSTPALPRPDERLPLHREAVRFFRHHPVASSGAFLAGISLLGWFALGPKPLAITAIEPEYTRVNSVTGTIEVYNKLDQQVWSKPLLDPDRANTMRAEGRTMALVLDMGGDGSKEVAIAEPLGGDSTSYFESVRLFSGSRELIAEIHPVHDVSFGSRKYTNQFGPAGLAACPRGERLGDLLLICMAHFRSPSVMSVYVAADSCAGEFWHYGHIHSPSIIPGLLGLQPGAVVAFGKNDAQDSAGISFPVMVVLDPLRISGRTESHLSRGFGYPACPGELAYVRFPTIDVLEALNETLSPMRVLSHGNQSFSVIASSPSVTIEYTFALDMKPISARPTVGFSELHKRLANEGRIRGWYDERYVEQLRDGLRFWDGKEWRKQPVVIGKAG